MLFRSRAELVLLGKDNFLIENGNIKKIGKDKLEDSNKTEFEKSLKENGGKLHTKVDGKLFESLKKILGDFELDL